MTFNATKSSAGIVDYGVATRSFPGELESGDHCAVMARPNGAIIAVVDGLGHGYEAAVAAKVAINTVAAQVNLHLIQIVKTCHQALARTRGAAMAITSLDASESSLTWLSIGNVAGVLLRASNQGEMQREHILMRGGVVGQRLPPLRTATLYLRKGDILIFATDGVRNGFYDAINALGTEQEIADHILLKHAKVTDDALVLVGRWNGRPETDSRD
jgi:phosphoserine phosphatase RsbX